MNKSEPGNTRFQKIRRSRCLKWIRHLAIAFFSCWVVLCLWQAPVFKRSVSFNELHGIWFTNMGAALSYYTTSLDDVMADMARHHLNTVYPAVWNRGYTLFPSDVAQKAGGPQRDRLTSFPLLPFQDSLRGVIHQGHRQNLRVIPWFEYGLLIPKNTAIARVHPDWLTTNQAGHTYRDPGKPSSLLHRGYQKIKQAPEGKNEAYLNPSHPEVQQFFTDLIVEVVHTYSVDGIQLDDHFAWPVELGYDPFTIKKYKLEHNGFAPPTNPTDPEWMAWRANQLTQLMTKIVSAVKAEKPNTLISLSPNTPDFSYNKYLQNWPLWVKQNLLNQVIVQVYRPELSAFKAELANPELRALSQQVPLSIGLYTGPIMNAKPIEQVANEVKTVRDSKYQGVSFFCWETTLWIFKGGSPEQVHQAFLALFKA